MYKGEGRNRGDMGGWGQMRGTRIGGCERGKSKIRSNGGKKEEKETGKRQRGVLKARGMMGGSRT